jgi:hypothetical protein
LAQVLILVTDLEAQLRVPRLEFDGLPPGTISHIHLAVAPGGASVLEPDRNLAGELPAQSLIRENRLGKIACPRKRSGFINLFVGDIHSGRTRARRHNAAGRGQEIFFTKANEGSEQEKFSFLFSASSAPPRDKGVLVSLIGIAGLSVYAAFQFSSRNCAFQPRTGFPIIFQ